MTTIIHWPSSSVPAGYGSIAFTTANVKREKFSTAAAVLPTAGKKNMGSPIHNVSIAELEPNPVIMYNAQK